MSLISANDVEFLGPIENWIRGEKEILVQIEFSRAGGNRSFEFFSSLADLIKRLRNLRPSTRITAYQQPQLSIRGAVDDEFIAECLRRIPDGSEFLVVELVPRSVDDFSWFHHEAGTSHLELTDALGSSRGKQVAVGEYPHLSADRQTSITAYVPDTSGKVRSGLY